MQRAFLIGILSLAGASALGACGSSTTSTASTASGGSATSSSKSASTGTGTGGTVGTGGSATTGTGGSTGTSVNNCTAAAATDMTGMAAVTINFGGTTIGLKYAPPCIKVTAGTMVTFAGDFTVHPLQAGTISGGVAPPPAAGSSPLPTTAMATGTTATFTVQPAGTYGYYCTVHGVADGMEGAIIAE